MSESNRPDPPPQIPEVTPKWSTTEIQFYYPVKDYDPKKTYCIPMHRIMVVHPRYAGQFEHVKDAPLFLVGIPPGVEGDALS